MTKHIPVRIWTQELVLPTYRVGEPNRNPMFLEKRAYQGSSGRVYPYPVIDRISDEKVDERHTVIFLENQYLKLMVMPGFGGRIQYAYDKTNNYPFIYHNRVIKPALVGLAGPWLSGGIEFNWPQHHRPGTYCPVDYTVRRNRDGSMTLWLSEIEPMWHLKSTLGMTLYPGKAFLEINIRLFNATALRQSFHLWTNPAVHVNDQYQSVFPPDVQAVYDHGKRDVSAFPIARGEYYKVDYSRGVDISWYKNIPVPTSYMAARSKYDFVGGYDHGKRAGMLHVADHHVVPGKKQWVWGCGDFGKAWDRNLTDAEGPYAELMCGVFADNQPDFSWLEPFEEKEVKQYFLPYKAIGYVRNATIDAAVSLDIDHGSARVGAYTTGTRRRAVVKLNNRGRTIWKRTQDLSPERPLIAQVRLGKGIRSTALELTVCAEDGARLVSYQSEPMPAEAIPQPTKAIPEPARVANNEALYFAGLHLEQYRHATREPEDYYREALRRDPQDVRSNNALGLLLLRRGQFDRAENYFRAGIRAQTRHNPNPQDGEPHYNLGVCLRYLRRLDEAFASFYKATWNAAMQDAAFFQLAQIAALRGEWEQALVFINRALARNAHNQKAAHLKQLVLRRLGHCQEAHKLAETAIARDPLDIWAQHELRLLERSRRPGAVIRQSQWLDPLRQIHTCLELASDYARAGAFTEAIDLLKAAPRGSVRAAGHTGEVGMPNARPMVFYFLGYYAFQKRDFRPAAKYFKLAAAQAPDCCFPNSLDSIPALQTALNINSRDARANFYLGNLWYDKRQVKEATLCWEKSRRTDPALPTVHRNLALVYFNQQHNPAKGLRAMELAFSLNPTDARVLYELDLLKKRAGLQPEKRLAFLKAHRATMESREDLLIEFITLLNFFGRHQAALELLMNRKFHPWEGGEGKVTGQYVTTLVEMAKSLLGQRDHQRSPEAHNLQANDAMASSPQPSRPGEKREQPRAGTAFRIMGGRHERDNLLHAIQLLQRARTYPPNLGEGKLHGTQENQVWFWLGAAHESLGEKPSAKEYFGKACLGMKAPSPAVYYNDQNPEAIFYQGLAWRKLGRESRACERFQILVDFATKHLKDHVVIDYFAVSLPEFMVFDDDPDLRNEINCRYLMALGFWGLGKRKQARQELRRALKLDPSHLPARLHLQMFQSRLG